MELGQGEGLCFLGRHLPLAHALSPVEGCISWFLHGVPVFQVFHQLSVWGWSEAQGCVCFLKAWQASWSRTRPWGVRLVFSILVSISES